jgi:hypothetical protein
MAEDRRGRKRGGAADGLWQGTQGAIAGSARDT